jgi:hypothetical protein
MTIAGAILAGIYHLTGYFQIWFQILGDIWIEKVFPRIGTPQKPKQILSQDSSSK